jgi:hypothetical protein
LAFLGPDVPLFGSSDYQGYLVNHQGDAAIRDYILQQVKK